jgi:molecular chaperone DnaK (HSP70)
LFINQEITQKIVVPSLLQQSGLVTLPAAVKQKLASLVEKAKKELTGLEKTFLSIEINDKIYTVPIERKAVEEACSQAFNQMIAPIEELISISQGGLESFDLVIPLEKASKLFLFEDWASQRFGTKLAPVMNQEEAIAKGASLAASVLFNAFKLGKRVTLEPLFVGKEAVKAKIGDQDLEIQWNKPFEVDDSIVYIQLDWEKDLYSMFICQKFHQRHQNNLMLLKAAAHQKQKHLKFLLLQQFLFLKFLLI